MIIRILTAQLLHVALGSVLLFALLPMPNHMMSIQTVHMDSAAPQINIVQGNAGGHSTSSCCDAIGPFVLTCDFLASQSARIPDYGVSERIAYSVPIAQSIYVRTLAPPPKI